MDNGDAKAFGSSRTTVDRPDARLSVEAYDDKYNMSHGRRGDALIFTYSEYDHNRQLTPRSNAESDATKCEIAFERLNYEVKVFPNLKKSDLLQELRNARDRIDDNCDSLVVVVMSHGGVLRNKEFICAYDADIDTCELWNTFTPEKCRSLAGKPKLFFIQACRGHEVDKGVKLGKLRRSNPGMSIEVDSADSHSIEEYVIPLFADMLVMWASYSGMYAFNTGRDGINGSVFIHFLTQELNTSAINDLSSTLLRVTRKVAIEYESVTTDDHRNNNKQIPQIWSTLMRKVYFSGSS